MKKNWQKSMILQQFRWVVRESIGRADLTGPYEVELIRTYGHKCRISGKEVGVTA